MVTGRAREHHDGTAVRADRPVGDDARGQHLVGEQQPCVAVAGRFEHLIMLGGTIETAAGARPRREGPSVTCPAVDLEEGPDDEVPSYRAPLPPSDRLWRHPSEVGGSGAATSDDPTKRAHGQTAVGRRTRRRGRGRVRGGRRHGRRRAARPQDRRAPRRRTGGGRPGRFDCVDPLELAGVSRGRGETRDRADRGRWPGRVGERFGRPLSR